MCFKACPVTTVTQKLWYGITFSCLSLLLTFLHLCWGLLWKKCLDSADQWFRLRHWGRRVGHLVLHCEQKWLVWRFIFSSWGSHSPAGSQRAAIAYHAKDESWVFQQRQLACDCLCTRLPRCPPVFGKREESLLWEIRCWKARWPVYILLLLPSSCFLPVSPLKALAGQCSGSSKWLAGSLSVVLLSCLISSLIKAPGKHLNMHIL